MSKIVYEGHGAGLKDERKTGGGDTASPFDYTLYCACEREGKPTQLGPLGRFTQNAEGIRSALCHVCNHVTIINKNGKVAGRLPFRLMKSH